MGGGGLNTYRLLYKGRGPPDWCLGWCGGINLLFIYSNINVLVFQGLLDNTETPVSGTAVTALTADVLDTAAEQQKQS